MLNHIAKHMELKNWDVRNDFDNRIINYQQICNIDNILIYFTEAPFTFVLVIVQLWTLLVQFSVTQFQSDLRDTRKFNERKQTRAQKISIFLLFQF